MKMINIQADRERKKSKARFEKARLRELERAKRARVQR
jgi:hypothetical protein